MDMLEVIFHIQEFLEDSDMVVQYDLNGNCLLRHVMGVEYLLLHTIENHILDPKTNPKQ